MKILVTGSTGLLGSSILRNAPSDVQLAATYNKVTMVPNLKCRYYHVDITNKSLIEETFKSFKPEVVIHTAAIATPDYCDKHQDEAYNVNVKGTKFILEACKKYNSAVVFITTNGVYDGKHPPYDEASKISPIDYYGKTKYEGEIMTQNSDVPFIIMRLITMYGWNNPLERQNPVTWLIKILGENKTPLNMVTDMYNNFLYVEEAAKAIWKAVKLKKYGESFNISGKNCISRYEFSKEIAKIFKIDSSMIYPVTLSFFKNFVPRPKNTCFITKKMETVLKMKPWTTKNGLIHMKNNLVTELGWKNIE